MSEFRPEFHLLRVEQVIAGAEFAPPLGVAQSAPTALGRETPERDLSQRKAASASVRLAGRFACNAAGAQFTCRKGI